MASSALDVFQRATSLAIHNVRFRSQVTPTFDYQPQPPGEPQPVPQRNLLMEIVKPEITIDTAMGPYTVAPYGTPTANYTPVYYLLAGIFLVGLWTTGRQALRLVF